MDVFFFFVFCFFFTFLEQAVDCDIEGNPHCNDSSRTCTYIEASQTSKCLCIPWGMNPTTKQCFSKYACYICLALMMMNLRWVFANDMVRSLIIQAST